jgi:hypothetical protein
MLLYVALAGVILLSISLFLSLTLSVRAKAQSIAEVEQQGVISLKTLTQIIRNASAITSPAIGATSTSLTITVPNAAKSPTIIDLANGFLRIKEGISNPVNLTDSHVSATNLIFFNLTGGSSRGTIRIQFTLSRINVSSTNEYNYTQNFISSATLR